MWFQGMVRCMRMKETKILELSNKFKADADKLLDETNLLNLLSNHGEVNVTGSYDYDLMMSGDIDIEVFGDFDRDKALETFNDLVNSTSFTGYMFFDWVTYKSDKWPLGYYIGFKQIMPGYEHQWKIDVWLIKDNSPRARNFQKSLKQITDMQKMLILKLKHWAKSQEDEIQSVDIYDAVLKNDMDLDEYRELLSKGGDE